MRHPLALLASSALLLAALPASAVVLYSDSFTYEDGLLQTTGAANWTTADYSGGSGGAGNLTVVGGAVSLVNDGDTTRRVIYQAPLAETVTAGSVFLGFTFSTSVATATTGGQRIAAFGDGSTEGMRGQVWLKTGSTPGTVLLGVSNSSGSSAATTWWGSDLLTATDYRVVVEYDRTAGTSRMWIDPVSIDSLFVADAAVSGSNRASVVLYNRTNVNLGSYLIDDVIAGTTFSDATMAIPEPGTFALLLTLPVLGLVALRRRSPR